jgi:hypothetical protein
MELEEFNNQFLLKDTDPNTHLSSVLKQYNETNIIDKTEYYMDKPCTINQEFLCAFFDMEIYNNRLSNRKFTHTKNLLMLKDYSTIVTKNADKVSDAYLRFKFLYKPTDEIIEKVLSLISSIDVLYELSEDCKIEINLGQNILLTKLLKKDINIFDTEEFLNSVTLDEHMDKCCTNVDDYCVGTYKYYFDDDNGYYLDIPLLDDFYFCGNSGDLIGLSHSSIKIEIINPCIWIMDLLSKYMSSTIYYGFEKVYFFNNVKRNFLNEVNLQFTSLSTYTDNLITNSVDMKYEYNTGICIKCKFIFISISAMEYNHDILPIILSTHISHDDKEEIISDDNITLYEFNNTTLYAMSVDPNYNMNNLTDCNLEYNDTIEMINLYQGDVECNNFNAIEKRKCIDLDNIRILLNDHRGHFNLNITLVSQELYRRHLKTIYRANKNKSYW